MHKNGFTMIELLVGIVIAMLCMITMLMLFKQISHIGVDTTQDAEYDAQLQSGILAAQKFIQNAGYGSGQQTDIAIGSFAGNPAIVWLFAKDLSATPLAYECQGIGEEITTEDGQTVHRLYLLKKTACGKTEAITAGTWEKDQSITVLRNNSTTPLYQYTMTAGACSPFGIEKANAKGLKQVTLTAARKHMSSGVGQNIQTVVCLNNIATT